MKYLLFVVAFLAVNIDFLKSVLIILFFPKLLNCDLYLNELNVLHICTCNRRNRLVFNVRKSATSITGKTTDIKQWFTVHKCVTRTATTSLSYKKKDSGGVTVWSHFHFFSSKLVGLV